MPEFLDEETYLVQSHHEPIIQAKTFNKVQLILDGNKKTERPEYFKNTVKDVNLPLRGFFFCPDFGRNLTGSASKGRSNRYYYYHCLSSC